MNTLEFLILGKNQSILEIVVRLVNAKENWNAIGFGDENLAQKHFLENKIDFVLLSSGIEDAVEKEFTNFCTQHQPDVEVIEHFGGGSGLLQSEIFDRLHKRKIIACEM